MQFSCRHESVRQRLASSPRVSHPFSSVQVQAVCLKKDIMNITKNLGMLLLAIYLVLIGISALIHTIAIPVIVTGILALAAGILILIGR
jgi:hypothetical protein